MGLIRNIALRFMGEAGGKAERDKASTSSCSTGFNCDPPFDGVQCSLNGLFCAWDCGGSDFDCTNQIFLPPALCQPTWTCSNGYVCGTDSQSIFLCGSAFEGCETRVTCKGKYVQCEDQGCRNLDGSKFDCKGFACGSSSSQTDPFNCRPPEIGVPGGFTCDNGANTFDCHHAYQCANSRMRPKYACYSSFICADRFECTVPVGEGYECVTFVCGTAQDLDYFDCALFNDDKCDDYDCQSFGG